MPNKIRLLFPILGASIFAAAFAADEPRVPTQSPPVVWLRGLSDLDKLKQSNPDHYARAERIMAAADQVCKPGPLRAVPTEAKAKDVSCESMLVLTSYPPKRQIGFTLDDVHYVALVVLTEAAAQFQRLPLDRTR